MSAVDYPKMCFRISCHGYSKAGSKEIPRPSVPFNLDQTDIIGCPLDPIFLVPQVKMSGENIDFPLVIVFP